MKIRSFDLLSFRNKMTICGVHCFYLTIALLVLLSAGQVQSAKRYKGHKVLRVVPRSTDDVTFLKELLQTRLDLDVWKAPSRVGNEVHIHLGPDIIEDFKVLLQERSLVVNTAKGDSQEVIDNQISCCKTDNGADDFDSCYHTLQEIHRELHRLEEAHPTMAKVLSLGNSHEGRRMLGIKIKRGRSKVKDLIFLNFGIHAREWISPATGMYLIRQLLNPPAYDKEIENMLDKFEWFFLPVSNVDGFSFAHEEDRLWRKNRRVINSSLPSHSGCVGVDLNRNFDSDQWGKGMGANHPCSDLYPGERPFSEIESSNIADYLSKHQHKMVAFFDVHSYSKLWISPWGWKDKKPPEYSSQMEILMKAGTDAIYDATGKQYTYGPIFSSIYPTYGDLTDYVYDKLNVTHSYGLELRPGDDEPNGFLLPDCEIVPTGREIMAALKAITPILAKGKIAASKVEKDENQIKSRRHVKSKEEAQLDKARRDGTRRNKTKRNETSRDKNRRVGTRRKERKPKRIDKIKLTHTSRDGEGSYETRDT